METVLTLKKSKFKIDLFGNILEIRKPTWSEIEKFQHDVNSKKDDEQKSLSLTRDLLTVLGIPSEIVSELELDHVTQIMDLVVPKKKD